MTWPQAVAWRVGRQLLARRQGTAVDVARQVAGVQAQVMSSAELAIGTRTGQPPERVRTALWADRSLVKTWAMRGTLHLFAADDLPTWVAALRRKEQAARRGAAWERYHGITVAQLDVTTAAVAEVLDATPMTRQELGEGVAEVSGDASLAEVVRTAFGGTILKVAAANGDLCFAPDRGRNVTFVNPRTWLAGDWSEPDAETATAVVARRFFDAYGPATADDFARWWGVSAAEGKRLLRPLAGELVTVDVDGEAALLTPAGADDIAGAVARRGHVRLLPAFDTYVLAPRSHRRHTWPEGLHARISRPAGWITPVLLVDGGIAGVWGHARRGGSVHLDVEAFAPLPRATRAAVETEAKTYEALLGAPVEVAWVDRLPSAT
ncbi:MAG: hypothetical protein V7605_1582 [Acidimicrobiaceae bacterium]